jgi:hypothetical protein
MFNQKPLDFTDLDGTVSAFGAILRLKHRAALFLAELRSRTKNPTGASQNVVCFYGANGAGHIFKTEFADKFSRFSIGRTSFGAGGVMAKQAAVRFGNGLGQVKPFVHFLKFIKITHNYSSLRVVYRFVPELSDIWPVEVIGLWIYTKSSSGESHGMIC